MQVEALKFHHSIYLVVRVTCQGLPHARVIKLEINQHYLYHSPCPVQPDHPLPWQDRMAPAEAR